MHPDECLNGCCPERVARFAQVRHTKRDRQPERQGSNCECAPRPPPRTIANQKPRQHAAERTQAVARNGKGQGEGDHTVDQRADAPVVPPAFPLIAPPLLTTPLRLLPTLPNSRPTHRTDSNACSANVSPRAAQLTPCSPAPRLISLVANY